MGLDDKLNALAADAAARRGAAQAEAPAIAAACKRFVELAIGQCLGRFPDYGDGWAVPGSDGYTMLFVTGSGELHKLSNVYTEDTGKPSYWFDPAPPITAEKLEDLMAARLR